MEDRETEKGKELVERQGRDLEHRELRREWDRTKMIILLSNLPYANIGKCLK